MRTFKLPGKAYVSVDQYHNDSVIFSQDDDDDDLVLRYPDNFDGKSNNHSSCVNCNS